jgi:hypothetical protein
VLCIAEYCGVDQGIFTRKPAMVMLFAIGGSRGGSGARPGMPGLTW